jgi:hypothetical protein
MSSLDLDLGKSRLDIGRRSRGSRVVSMCKVQVACLVVFLLGLCSSGLDCSRGVSRANLLLDSGLDHL